MTLSLRKPRQHALILLHAVHAFQDKQGRGLESCNASATVSISGILLPLQERILQIEGFRMLNGFQSPVLFPDEMCRFRKHFRSSRSLLATATVLFQHTGCSFHRTHVTKLGLKKIVPPP